MELPDDALAHVTGPAEEAAIDNGEIVVRDDEGKAEAEAKTEEFDDNETAGTEKSEAGKADLDDRKNTA